MKNVFPYIIGGLLLLLLVIIMLSGKAVLQHRMDERITLKQRDKIPYGTSATRALLPELFPSATMLYDIRYPGSWDSISVGESGQAVILITDYFDADGDELKELGDFVANGNYVFIIAKSASDTVSEYFNLSYNSPYSNYNGYLQKDSLRIRLLPPVFAIDSSFVYPGRRYESFFNKIDMARTVVLGSNERSKPNFIRMDKGRGSFFIHAAPLAFSNYFILHKNNIVYYESALSVIPKSVRTVLWNEYYLNKPQDPTDNKEPDWLGALFQYPAFKWGLLIAFFSLAIFVLLGMRRKQRMIPAYQKPANDSLDFVKTLGRLYYDKKDHKNLANKMAAYFLEHVRSVHKLPTHTLDEDFTQALHVKSSYPKEETKAIIASINNLKTVPSITETQLANFYKGLELFYQNT
jgi:hypothetical protein